MCENCPLHTNWFFHIIEAVLQRDVKNTTTHWPESIFDDDHLPELMSSGRTSKTTLESFWRIHDNYTCYTAAAHTTCNVNEVYFLHNESLINFSSVQSSHIAPRPADERLIDFHGSWLQTLSFKVSCVRYPKLNSIIITVSHLWWSNLHIFAIITTHNNTLRERCINIRLHTLSNQRQKSGKFPFTMLYDCLYVYEHNFALFALLTDSRARSP